MLLAELEVWHTRPAVPTRRIALGHMVLPVDPAPGFGGLLLGSILAAHLGGIDDDLIPDIHRLITGMTGGWTDARRRDSEKRLTAGTSAVRWLTAATRRA